MSKEDFLRFNIISLVYGDLKYTKQTKMLCANLIKTDTVGEERSQMSTFFLLES